MTVRNNTMLHITANSSQELCQGLWLLFAKLTIKELIATKYSIVFKVFLALLFSFSGLIFWTATKKKDICLIQISGLPKDYNNYLRGCTLKTCCKKRYKRHLRGRLPRYWQQKNNTVCS